MTKHLLFSLFPVVTQENKHQKLQNTKWKKITYSFYFFAYAVLFIARDHFKSTEDEKQGLMWIRRHVEERVKML